MLIRAGGANIRQLFALQRVDGEIVAAGVQADHLPLIHLFIGADKQLATLLQIEECEAKRLAGAIGDQCAVATRCNAAFMGFAIVLEDMVDESCAGGCGHEFCLKSNQAAGGNDVVKTHPPRPIRQHILELTAAFSKRLHDGSLVRIFHIHGEAFIGLAPLAFDLPEDNFRT